MMRSLMRSCAAAAGARALNMFTLCSKARNINQGPRSHPLGTPFAPLVGREDCVVDRGRSGGDRPWPPASPGGPRPPPAPAARQLWCQHRLRRRNTCSTGNTGATPAAPVQHQQRRGHRRSKGSTGSTGAAPVQHRQHQRSADTGSTRATPAAPAGRKARRQFVSRVSG
eukprot:12903819-Alexandrium_andersonii.AAC.1